MDEFAYYLVCEANKIAFPEFYYSTENSAEQNKTGGIKGWQDKSISKEIVG